MRNVVRMREGLQHCLGGESCVRCPYAKRDGCARTLAMEIDHALAELEALPQEALPTEAPR